MMEFVKQASSSFGISEEATGNLTGGLLGMMQKSTDGGTFDQLLAKIPGADGLIQQASAVPSAAGAPGATPEKGGMMGQLGSMLGGQGGGALGLAGLFQQSGIGMDKAGSFVSMFIGFIRSKAGNELVEKLLGQMPDLKKLAG